VLLILVGMMFCYIPGIAVALLFTMAPTMVYLHGKGAVAALSQSFAQIRKNPGPYLIIGLVQFGIGLVAAYIPVLGAMFSIALHVRAYREIYGDDEEPNLDTLA
jgi:uncharacterized membrane protein